MTFRCEPATLSRLEWSSLLERLAAQASTVRGAEACAALPFEPDLMASRERLEETSESRRMLDLGDAIPFGGVCDLRDRLEAVARGLALSESDLADVLGTVSAARRIRGALAGRAESAPRLADLAGTLGDLQALERLLDRHLDRDGTLRDDATPALARASKEVRRLESEIERRMAACVRDPEIASHLQDHYATFREGRPVLPVRADSRRAVRGILHDVSSSGTTVFIEPESVVEPGNRLRIAQTEHRREVERILRQLSDAVRGELLELEAQGATLEKLDAAQARARLSQLLDATSPVLGDAEELVELRELRHPLLLLEGGLDAGEVVANDVVLAPGARGLVISGPNAGGKTVLAKALGLAVLSARAGLHVACAPGSRLPWIDAVWADIGDEQDLRAGLSTFSARMSNLARVLGDADDHTLVIVDEIGEGTEPGEGAALAQAVLEALVDRGALVVTTTHFNRLKELAGSDARFVNASAEFDPETLLPTFRVHIGAPGSSGATWVAERMGVDADVVERARSLLDHEDRRLEALTRGLSELRQELETERRLAGQMRAETESAREEYETRLSALRSAREEALSAMKADLEQAFQDARRQIADVVRQLQRGEHARGPAANRAQRALRSIRARTEAVESAHDEVPRAESPRAIDWSRVAPGSSVRLESVREEGVLVEGPDARGRVVVRVGGARMTVPQARVAQVGAAPRPAPAPRVEVQRAPEAREGTSECDLRGLRVDEALDHAEAHLQSVLGTGQRRVTFIHGHGTGALRSAVRSWLRNLPEVSEFAPGAPNEGGTGVTIATLAY